MTLLATTRDEVPLFFPAGGESLFGILTRPTVRPNDTAVIVLSGGGAHSAHSTNRNRFSVRLCRRLAGQGFHTVRFDYHGVGESTGVIERFRLDEPFTDDLFGVIDCLRDQGIHKSVLIGSSCFGARTALSSAPQIQGLQAIVLGSPPVRDFEMGERVSTRLALEWSSRDYLRAAMQRSVLKGLRNAKKRRKYASIVKAKWRALRSSRSAGNGSSSEAYWRAPVSDNFASPLIELTKNDIPVLFIYGRDDDFYADFQRAREVKLGAVLDHPSVQVTTFPGKFHGLGQVQAQEEFMDLVCSWLPQKSLLA